jgi:hypothetical protein
VAPEPAAPDRAAIYAHYEKESLTGIGRFKRAERAAAKQRAAAWADAEVNRQWQALNGQQARWQQTLDQRWRLLCGNDPDVVLQTLAEAFEDNEAPSAALGVDGAEVSLVLLVPSAAQAIPEQMPARTPAGNLSLKKVTQTTQADYYKQFVCGQILVTLRETFAVAPGLVSARVVVLRNDGRDLYGQPVMPCLAAVNVAREALLGVRWNDADAVDILNAVAREKLINQKGRSKELRSPRSASRNESVAAGRGRFSSLLDGVGVGVGSVVGSAISVPCVFGVGVAVLDVGLTVCRGCSSGVSSDGALGVAAALTSAPAWISRPRLCGIGWGGTLRCWYSE